MELSQLEIRKRLQKLQRLIEWKLTNVSATLQEKEADNDKLTEATNLIFRSIGGIYSEKHLHRANALWKEFKAFVTGSLPDEVDKDS